MATEEGPYTIMGARAGVVGAVVGVLALAVGLAGLVLSAALGKWGPFAENSEGTSSSPETCAERPMDTAADRDDRLRPPEDLSIRWEASATAPGRAAATVSWKNVDARTASGLIEVTGRFGAKMDKDIPYRLDGRDIPAEGLCGHWYREYTHPSHLEGVFFDRLWPGEKYCFAVNSADEDGGPIPPVPSINTPPKCEVAPKS